MLNSPTYVRMHTSRPLLGKFTGRGGQGSGSPNGAAAVAAPVTLQTSNSKIQSGFNVDPRKSERAVNSGYLDEFVEEQMCLDERTPHTSGLGSSSGDNSSAGVRNQSRGSVSQPSDGRGSASIDSGNHGGDVGGIADSARVSSAEHHSPVEPAYLEGYGEENFLKKKVPDAPALPPQNGGNEADEGAGVVICKQSSSFDDTLGPWKAEKSKHSNPCDDHEIRGEAILPSLAVNNRVTEESEDTGAGGFKGYGGPSDEETGGFGETKERHYDEFEEEEEEEEDWRCGIESRQRQISPSDCKSAAARNPFDYGYGDPGTYNISMEKCGKECIATYSIPYSLDDKLGGGGLLICS